MDITVVIPTYNHGRYLAQAIESVVAQDVVMELYILDNASTDDTAHVVEKYLSLSWIHYIRHETNIGGIPNHQRAFLLGTGRYIKIMGADDWLLPGHLKQSIETLEAHPRCCLSYCPCVWVDSDGGFRGVLQHPGHKSMSYYGNRNEFVDLLINDCYLTLVAVTIRRRALQAIGEVDTNLLGAFDWDYWVRLAKHCNNFAFMENPSVVYRTYPERGPGNFYLTDDPLKDHLSILEKHLDKRGLYLIMGCKREIFSHLLRRAAGYPINIDTWRRIDAVGKGLGLI